MGRWLLTLLVSGIAFGYGAKSSNVRVHTLIGMNYGFASPLADQVAGASYTERFRNPLIASASLGLAVFKKIYIGGRYEYWYARRNFSMGAGGQVDELNYQGLTGEVGWYLSNPRVYLMVLGTITMPLVIQASAVGTVSGDFENVSKPIAFGGRIVSGVRFGRFFSVFLEGGYRKIDLGNLGGYPAAGEVLDMSGPFLGGGVGFEF